MTAEWLCVDKRVSTGPRRLGVPIDYARTTKPGEQFQVQWTDGEIEAVQTPRDVFVLDPCSLHALVEFGDRSFAGPADLDVEVFVRALPRQGFVNNAQALQKTVAALTRMDPAVVRAAWSKVGAAVRDHAHVEYGAGQGNKGYRLREPLPPVVDLATLSVPDLNSADDSATFNIAEAAVVIDTGGGSTTSRSLESPPFDDSLLAVDEAVLQAGPLKSDTDVLEGWWTSDRPAALLLRVADDYMRAPAKSPQGRQKRSELATLVSRTLARRGFDPAPEVWFSAFSALSRGSRADEQPRILALLSRATERVARVDEDEVLQLPANFVRALGQLPLEPGGPRHAFLDALARVSRDAVASPELWSGLEWAHIGGLSRGPAGSVLANERRLIALVRESVDQLVASMASRSALSTFFSLPQFATEHVDPVAVVAGLERVGKNDTQASRWLGSYRDGPEQRAIRAERDRLHDEVSARAESVAELRHEISELHSALHEAHLQVAQLQEMGGAASDRELRHAQIDAARSVAQVAVTVESDGSHLEHDQLVQKVSRLVERFGLSPSATRGDDLAFDPEKHSAPGTRPEIGEIVHVARTGYIWKHGDEDIVVLPALVTRLTP